jgi:hypothetical protein
MDYSSRRRNSKKARGVPHEIMVLISHLWQSVKYDSVKCEKRMRQTTTAEVRLDEGNATIAGAARQTTHRFGRLTAAMLHCIITEAGG